LNNPQQSTDNTRETIHGALRASWHINTEKVINVPKHRGIEKEMRYVAKQVTDAIP